MAKPILNMKNGLCYAVIIHCECGLCEHRSEKECIRKECSCCNNFHVRSGGHGQRTRFSD